MAPAHDVFGLVGTTIVGAFQVEDVVAEGGFAVVYRAYHAGFRAPVALKCLKIPQYFSQEEQRRFQEQFQTEAELLFKLSASIPHVVRPLHIEAVIAPDGSFMPFMALEWLEGQTSDLYVQGLHERGSLLRLPDLVLLLTPVARALEKAHKFAGPEGPISIVHRDMKPKNVFIARVAGEETVKVLDFGIAKARSMATQVASHSAEEAAPESFSPAYGAPEQWMPTRYGYTGPWTDVWGLAITLVELAARRPIIVGDRDAMMRTVTEPSWRPTPRGLGIALPDAVEAVFRRALAVDPKHRYADAGAFWDELLTSFGLDANEGRASESGSYQAVWGSVARAARTSSAAIVPSGAPALIPDLDISPSRRPPRSGGDLRNLPGPTLEHSGIELDVDAAPPRRPASTVSAPSSADDSLRPVIAPASSASARISDPSLPAVPSSALRPPTSAPSARSSLRDVPEPMSWMRRLAPAVAMIAGGILITAVDMAYASSAGEVLYLGPLRPAWIAAVLVLTGIGLLIYRLLPQED